MHTSSMRYGPVLGGARDRILPSSEVRVSYFDPTTGEPLDRKPTIERKSSEIEERVRNRDAWAARDAEHRAAVEDADRIMREARERRSSKARAAARRGGRRPKPVVVDGVTHPSVNAAARAMGCAPSHLSKKLNAGMREHMGRSVRYEEER